MGISGVVVVKILSLVGVLRAVDVVGARAEKPEEYRNPRVRTMTRAGVHIIRIVASQD